ncbi:MAG: hypothetical protein IJV45_02895 [Prevotella sp.]|nr:hypothetical protein [Prevotella sp.]
MMKLLRHVLLLWLVLLFSGQTAEGARPAGETATCGTIEGKKQDPPAQAATLSDATEGYRLSTTRPQRVVPTNIVSSQRTSGKHTHGDGDRLRQQYSRFKNFGDWPRQLSLPLRPFVSRYYYIIALRRILR